MTEPQLAHLQWLVLSSTAVVSLFLGALFHRSHFCTMGAVSDAVIMENFDRLRQWALALAVAIFGFGCMAYAGLINPLQSIYATKDLLWLSSLLGGLLFGWGTGVEWRNVEELSKIEHRLFVIFCGVLGIA